MRIKVNNPSSILCDQKHAVKSSLSFDISPTYSEKKSPPARFKNYSN
jgi:hypothetical protein